MCGPKQIGAHSNLYDYFMNLHFCLRELICKHLFLNPSGTPNGNIEMDLEQEFFNNLLKVSDFIMRALKMRG